MRAAVEKRRHDRTSQDVLVMCAPVLGSASGEIFELPMSPSTTLLLLKCSWPSPRSSAATSIDVSLQRLKRSVSPWRTYAHRSFGARLEVGDERFNSIEIQRLYEAIRCVGRVTERSPCARNDATGAPFGVRQSGRCLRIQLTAPEG
jgi:hypothetical protein